MASWIRVDPFNGTLPVIVKGEYHESTRFLLVATRDEIFTLVG